jgi:hypothetical protein
LDGLRFDLERLQGLASEAVVRRGLAYFAENRVTDLRFEVGVAVSASVDGHAEDRLPYAVTCELDADAELLATCSCPFNAEPACKHIVAVLVAYDRAQPVDGLASAEDEAVERRIQRGRTEVKVKPLPGGDGWFGGWEARSLRPDSTGAWRVLIRDLGARRNACGCPDFAINGLGTCKHIEAVLHCLRDKAPVKFQRLAAVGPSVPVLWWDGDAGVVTRQPARVRAEADVALDPLFAADQRFIGRFPEDWPELQRRAEASGALVSPEIGAAAARSSASGVATRTAEVVRADLARGDGLRVALMPYQVEGAAFLASRGRALLADDMGLGKTLQAIAAARVLMDRSFVRRVVVLCPSSLKRQWADEIARFTGDVAEVVTGGARARHQQYRGRPRWTIVSYDAARSDVSELMAHLAPDLLILDEAQRLRNWRTKTAAAVKSLRTSFCFVLTGTPMENRLEDLYSVMQLVDPTVLGPLWRFLLTYQIQDERGRVLGSRNLADLRRRLAPVMLRREREVVKAQLPSRTDQRRDVELSPTQVRLHNAALRGAQSIVQQAQDQHRALTPGEEKRLMALLQTARLACDAAVLVNPAAEPGSPKLDELTRLLEALCVEGGRKVVLFSQWRKMAELAVGVVESLGLRAELLHGGVADNERPRRIRRFMTDPDVSVFVSTDAGATGLNLQAGTALIHLDVPYNPALMDQRSARIHRLGQTEPVQIFYLVASQAYEGAVWDIVQGKAALFRGVTGQDDVDVVGVTRRTLASAMEALARVDTTGVVGPDEPLPDLGEVTPGEPEELPEVPDMPEPPAPDLQGDRSPTESLDAAIAEVNGALGARIERVVVGAEGVVFVVDKLDAETSALQLGLEGRVPLSFVDRRTFAMLSRGAPAAPPRLAAARALLAVGQAELAVAAAVDAMLAALAARVGQPAPAREAAAAWVFGALLPAQVLSPVDAVAVAGALALAAGAVDAGVAEQVLASVAGVVG